MLAITAFAVLLAMLEVTTCGNEGRTARDGRRIRKPARDVLIPHKATSVKGVTRDSTQNRIKIFPEQWVIHGDSQTHQVRNAPNNSQPSEGFESLRGVSRIQMLMEHNY